MSTQEIENLEAELAQAMLGNDIAILDRLLSDDLVFSGPDGGIVNKAQDLVLHQSGDIIFTTYEIGELIVTMLRSDVNCSRKSNISGQLQRRRFCRRFSVPANLSEAE